MPCMIHTWQHWSYSPVLCHHKHHRSSHPSSVCASVTPLHYQLAWCLKERANWRLELCCRCGPAGSGPTSQRWMGKRTRQSLHFAQRVAWWMPLLSGRVPNPLHPMSSHHHWPVATVTLTQLEQWLSPSNELPSSLACCNSYSNLHSHNWSNDCLHPMSCHHHWPVAMVSLKQSEQWLFLSNVAMSSHHHWPVANVKTIDIIDYSCDVTLVCAILSNNIFVSKTQLSFLYFT